MVDLYTPPAISGYNSSPPTDDDTIEILWATHISKIGGPLNTFAAAINAEINTAFGKVFGNTVVPVATAPVWVLTTWTILSLGLKTQ